MQKVLLLALCVDLFFGAFDVLSRKGEFFENLNRLDIRILVLFLFLSKQYY
jgi:hypothetical protein